MAYYTSPGTLIKGTGGLYLVRTDKSDAPLSGQNVLCRARGSLRSSGLLIGDRVEITYSDLSFSRDSEGNTSPAVDPSGVPDCAVSRVLERKNRLIRPQMANLDVLFTVCASARPDPDTLIIDKMLAVCEYFGIQAVLIIGKCELSPENTEKFMDIYTKSGYPVFPVSCAENTGTEALRGYIDGAMKGKIAAFAGVSGVGKSTLMGRLFPELELATGDVSARTGRGKHTTRHIELFPVKAGDGEGLLADTPGFSLIDFENFDFLPFEALGDCFPDFVPFYGGCRYLDCTHTREKECGVAAAISDGKLSPTRRESYVAMYDVLKNKHRWD